MDKRDKLDQFKKNEGFKMPEGYFETLNSEVMASLPKTAERELEVIEVSKWTKMKPLIYLAAMFIGAALIIKVALPSFVTESPELYAQEFDEEEVSDEFIQETIDAALLDDYSMYMFLNEDLDSYEE